MSTETATVSSPGHEPASAHDDHAHHGPSDKQYLVVAAVLAVFTAIEVLTYFVDFGSALVPTLLALMVIKFALIILYFMHLKFDDKLLLRIFVAGLVLALAVYFVVFFAFKFFSAGVPH